MRKRNIIQRFDNSDAVKDRLGCLSNWIDQNKANSQISLRVYTSRDAPTLLVEKWGFADQATEIKFFLETASELGPWPESDYADGHGKLVQFTEKEWDE